jgi:hypothetical protein
MRLTEIVYTLDGPVTALLTSTAANADGSSPVAELDRSLHIDGSHRLIGNAICIGAGVFDRRGESQSAFAHRTPMTGRF